jgi:hypothetical protein
MKHECQQEKAIDVLFEKHETLDKAIFKGNGTPSILARIAVMDEKFCTMDKKLDSIISIGRAALIALLSVLAATAWDMVKRYHAETGKDDGSSKTAKMEVKSYDY